MVYIVHTLESKSRIFFSSVLHVLSKKRTFQKHEQVLLAQREKGLTYQKPKPRIMFSFSEVHF